MFVDEETAKELTQAAQQQTNIPTDVSQITQQASPSADMVRQSAGPKYKATSEYVKTYTSYSGHDMVCIFEIPLVGGGTIAKVVGEVQTISYSVHNEKMPVRVLGDMNMKSIVFGNRTVAGSIVFVVFDQHWAYSLMQDYRKAIGSGAHILTDELPPINVTISMANEYGDRSRLAIYGVTFVNEGQVMSINDVYTENTFQFYGKDVDYLTTDVYRNYSGTDNSERLKAINGKIDDLNSDTNAPVDIPSTTISDAINSGIQGDVYYGGSVASKDFDVYDTSYQALSAGRDAYLSDMDSKYQGLIEGIGQKLQNNEIKQSDYDQQIKEAKEIYAKRRSQADDFYARQAQRELTQEDSGDNDSNSEGVSGE